MILLHETEVSLSRSPNPQAAWHSFVEWAVMIEDHAFGPDVTLGGVDISQGATVDMTISEAEEWAKDWLQEVHQDLAKHGENVRELYAPEIVEAILEQIY